MAQKILFFGITPKKERFRFIQKYTHNLWTSTSQKFKYLREPLYAAPRRPVYSTLLKNGKKKFAINDNTFYFHVEKKY